MAGSPDVKPLSELTPDELNSELFLLLKRLEAHSIEVDFLCEVKPAEQYRFLTEELLNEEMDDIHIPGMTSHFIYEEFHPNAEYDAQSAAEMFVRSLLSRNTEFLMTHFSKDELYDFQGKPLSREQMQEKTEAFFSTYIETEDWEVTPTLCQIEGDYAQVEADASWEGVAGLRHPLGQLFRRSQSTAKTESLRRMGRHPGNGSRLGIRRLQCPG